MKSIIYRMRSFLSQIRRKLFAGKSRKQIFFQLLIAAFIGAFVVAGLIIIWVSTFTLPKLNNFEDRQVVESTRIYDRTGEVILFDVHGDIKRTVISFNEMSDYVKDATVAIEDANFYNHNGIEPKAILRAILINIKNGDLLGGQGGSTITQQVIKNALLTTDKKVSRKIKEWVLAPRLEDILTKDEILEVYLNEVPYGGNIYGIQEASRRFFAKDAKDLSLAQAAYLAALPQAPTYYSPFGSHTDDLDLRKNRVLRSMLENKFITENQYEDARDEKVAFEKPESSAIKAPHFVIWVREYLVEKYGEEAVQQGGLKVITTLDYKLQKEAEDIVKAAALSNEKEFNAENAAIVALEATTGQVLVMVGSRDYFDDQIDGNYNLALADRQPGSTFKPIAYAEAFNKGYRPDTIVFDVSTEFSTTCSSGGNCYRPTNYDSIYRGPISMRNALAQSINVPAVQTLYLAGIEDSLQLAKNMGLTTLADAKRYGLTLVLGGGEVRPLDLASAYGVFATDGVKHEVTGIIRVEDSRGNPLEEYQDKATRVMSEQTARLVTDVLTDNNARTPAFGANSPLYFPGVDVAAKTGTTNDYRDAWTVGYTPKVSVVAWAGNNDNTSMEKKVAGFIVSPLWNKFMQRIINEYPAGSFTNPDPLSNDVKPIIRGEWAGNGGKGDVHTILHYVRRSDPLGPAPTNPYSDPQYALWEAGVQSWLGTSYNPNVTGTSTDSNRSSLVIVSPESGMDYTGSRDLMVAVLLSGENVQIASGKVFVNGDEIGDIDAVSGSFTFIPNDISGIRSRNTLKVTVKDTFGKDYSKSMSFGVQR